MNLLEERNNEILKLRKKGWTISTLAAKFRISGTRVQQIWDRAERRKREAQHSPFPGLSVQIHNCFISGRINNVDTLCEKTRYELLNLRNFGKISLKKTETFLNSIGRKLKEKP